MSVQLSCSFVSPTSFLFGDEDLTPVDCYTERFNYTYKVSIKCSFRGVQTEYKLKRAERLKVILIKCVKCKSSDDSEKKNLIAEPSNLPDKQTNNKKES